MKYFLLSLLFAAQFSFGALTKIPFSGLQTDAISTDLTFSKTSTVVVKTKDNSVATQDFQVRTGTSTAAASGGLTIVTGSSPTYTGDIQVRSGGASPTGDSGWVSMFSGDAPGTSGSMEIDTGQSNTGVSGSIELSSGRSLLNNSGQVQIYTGDADANNSGALSLSTGNGDLTSGNIYITSGTATSPANRGEINLDSLQVNLNTTKIVNLANPTNNQDAATKTYVDNVAIGTNNITDGSITSADISASAAIPYSKLNLNNSLVSGDLTTGAVTSSKILDGTIVSGDISGTAGILYSQLTLGSNITSANITDSTIVSGDISASAGILGSQLSSAAAITSGQILDGTLTSADISASAAIPYSKLNLATSITSGDISATAAIPYSKLNLATSITSGDISASAAIPYSKLNLSASLVSGDLATSAVTTAKILDGTITSADISSSAGIAYSQISLNNSIVSGDLTTSAVTTAKILDGTITSADLSTASGLAIKGSSTNDAGVAGYVGEYISSVVSGVASATSGQYKDLTSITLTAGDWDISLNTYATTGGTCSQAIAGIGTVTGNDTTGLVDGDSRSNMPGPVNGVSNIAIVVPGYRVSISGSTTYYAKIFASYTTSVTWAGRLSARRVR